MSEGDTTKPWTRRALLAQAGSAAAGIVLGGCVPEAARAGEQEGRAMTNERRRMPTVYLPHGGGPWPFVDIGFGRPEEWDRLRAYLVGLASLTGQRPAALLVI